MNEKGWIKMYRKTESNPIVCKDNDYFRVWHHLMYNATHKKQPVIFNNQKIILKPGQYITGSQQVADKCNITRSKAERILKWFENDQQIEQQTTNKGRLITILNWSKYQNFEQQNAERAGNTQAVLKQVTVTNNNVKNVKNNKKCVCSDSTTLTPTLAQLLNFAFENFKDYLDEDLKKSCNKFFNYYEDNGWNKVKNWESKLKLWISDDIDNGKIKEIKKIKKKKYIELDENGEIIEVER